MSSHFLLPLRLAQWIWKNGSAFTLIFYFYLFIFLLTPAAQKNALFTILLFTVKVSRPPRTINHLPVCSQPASLWRPDSKTLSESETFLYVWCIFFPGPYLMGVMEKPNWTSGETESRFLWWKLGVSTGCLTSKLHFSGTHGAARHTSHHFLCSKRTEEPSVIENFHVCAPLACALPRPPSSVWEIMAADRG